MALIKDGRKRKKGKPTLIPKGFKGKSKQAGHEERLASFIKRTVALKQQGYPYYEIAEVIAQEFNLTTIPHIATVAQWRQKGLDAIQEDIRQLQLQLRIDQFNELERMKSKWMPLATAEELTIRRWVRIEGELQPELDEDAVKEQIEATKQVIAIMARQAKLLGLDLEKSVDEKGEGPGSLQDLQIWLIGQVNINSSAGGAIDIQSEVLELKSGIPEVDNDSL